nr:MAG: protein of unknown function DUF3310 [Bacteriophage sp.]
MYRDGAHRKACESLALHGRYIDAGEKVYAPERHAGEVEPIDIIERVVGGLPPDRAYGLGQVLGYCPRAGKKDDMDVEPGKADDYAHRSVFGHWRSR